MGNLPRRDFLFHAGGGLAALAIGPDLLAWRGRAAALPPGVQLSVGVVGTGERGRQALDELAGMESVEVVAICDEDPGRLKGGQRRAEAAQAFTSIADFLENAFGLQAVLIGTPTHRHLEVVEAALASGRHVYCEAPLAHTTEAARAICAAAAAAPSRICVAGFTARANPLYLRTRGVAQSDAVGALLGAHVHAHRRESWRQAAPEPEWEAQRNWRLDPAISLGLPGEIGAHWLDYLLLTTRLTPASVRAHGGVLAWNDGRRIADTVQVEIACTGGAAWTLDLTIGNSYGQEQALVYGAHGAVRAAETHAWLFKEADSPTQGWEVYATREHHQKDEGLVLLANATKLAEQSKLKEGIGLPHSPLWYALDDFVAACLGGGKPACSFADALPATELAISAAAALRDGTAISFTK
jgi:predicted dehydrogenase